MTSILALVSNQDFYLLSIGKSVLTNIIFFQIFNGMHNIPIKEVMFITGWERERLSMSNAPVFVSEAPVLYKCHGVFERAPVIPELLKISS